jgi:tetratricopeptide (TPR) repeat protein
MKNWLQWLFCLVVVLGIAGCAKTATLEITPQPVVEETQPPEVQFTHTPVNTPTIPAVQTATNTASPIPSLFPTQTSDPQAISRLDQTDIYCSSENDEAISSYNEALLQQEEGNLEASIEFYLRAIELDPTYCDAMDNLGQLYRSQGELEEAVYWYKESLSVYPENAAAHQNLAVAYTFLKDYEQAIQEYELLIDLYPTNPEGYFGLGQVYLETGLLDEAIENYEKAETLYEVNESPYIVDARFSLGITYMLKGDYIAARGYFEAVYDEFEDLPILNYYIGVCYLMIPGEDVAEGRKYILKAQEAGLTIPEYILDIIQQ